MRFWLTVLGIVLTLAPSAASAGPITITWTGPVGWYNGDWLSICRETSRDCDFWNDLQSRGISLTNPVSETPLTFSMTFRDAISDAAGVFNTTTDIFFEFGGLVIVSSSAVQLANGLGPCCTNGGLGIVTEFDDTAPVIGDYGVRPSGISLASFGFHSVPNVSLISLFSQQPLAALSSNYCISLGASDCDLIGEFSAVSVSVPEAPSLLLSSGAILFAVVRRAYHRRGRRSSDA
jgi:hypothetical protein